jgi:maleate cis-trans isomerase
MMSTGSGRAAIVSRATCPPAGSTCRTLRIPRGKGTLTPKDLPAYVGQAMKMATAFADDGIDRVVYGCTPAQIAALSREVMRASCDALFIACSQLPTREILPGLERDFGRPAWSSIRATAWQACGAGQEAITER